MRIFSAILISMLAFLAPQPSRAQGLANAIRLIVPVPAGGSTRRLEPVAVTGREDAVEVAAIGHDPRLVQGGPHLHAVIERAHDGRRVIGEPAGDVGVQPSAAIVERRGEIPVVEGHHGLYV